jgi:ribosomal-protein-alanine N-acetyltransferase
MESRLLSEHNVAAMAHLLKEGFPASLWSSDDLNKFMTLDTCKAWGKFQNATLVAFILVQMAADEAEILLIVVHPSYRRKGIAFSLLNLMKNYLEHTKVARLFLEVSVENESAISFYKEVGFDIVGTRKDYYTHKQNKSAYIMLKRI